MKIWIGVTTDLSVNGHELQPLRGSVFPPEARSLALLPPASAFLPLPPYTSSHSLPRPLAQDRFPVRQKVSFDPVTSKFGIPSHGRRGWGSG